MTSQVKLLSLFMYMITFFPFFKEFKEEKIIGLLIIIPIIVYSVSLMLEFYNIIRPILFIHILAITYLIYLTKNNNLLIPLSLLPFIISFIDEEINSSFLKGLSIFMIICNIGTNYLFGNSLSSTNLNIIYPNIFNICSAIYACLFLNSNLNLYNIIKNNDIEIKELKKEKQNLEMKIKNHETSSLHEDNYLAVVLGLDFDGFDYEDNVSKILNTIKISTNAIFGAFYKLNPMDKTFVLQKKYGESSLLIEKPIPAGHGMIGSTYDSKQYSCVTNIQEKEQDEYKKQLLNNVNCLVAIPIIVKGEVTAAISVGFASTTQKKETDLINLCCIIANKVNIEFEKMAQHIETEKKSITDKLTGLYNRLFFDEKIKELYDNCQRENKYLAYVEIDLDFFKQMNDTHGHDFGDKVLKTAASVFKNNIRSSDYAFRTGGDEFSLVLLGADKKAAFNITKNIAKIYAQKVEELHLYAKKDGQDVKSSFSIGIAVCPNDKAKNISEIIKQADNAVYVVKENGKNNICIAK